MNLSLIICISCVLLKSLLIYRLRPSSLKTFPNYYFLFNMMKKSLLILGTYLLMATPCFASVESIPIRHYKIRQERLAKNGVLISRPDQSDQEIAAIVSQNQIHTLEDYTAWLEKNMTYKADLPKDQWLKPDEFLKIKQGDCEDYAFLNSQVLRVLGFSPHIITLYSSKSAHAICAFEYRGKFYWFDNAKIKSSNANNLTAFAKEITDRFHYSHSFELNPQTQKSSLIYERS